MDQPAIYHLAIDGHVLEAREVRGREEMSRPYRFEVALTLPPDVEIDPDAVLKTEASLMLLREEPVRTIRALVGEVYVEAKLEGRPELTVVLEPRIAWARFRQDVRAFLYKDVPTIVEEVLGGLGIDVERRLSGSYEARDYCVQHRETDLHFASRLLEEEGIFYFVSDDGAVVLGDSAGAYDKVSGPTSVPFRFASGIDHFKESVWAFGELSRATVGKVSLRDWTPEAPSLPMDVSASGPTANGPEYYDFPGEYEQPAGGQRMADLMAEAYACRADAAAGKATCPGFGAGRTFTLTDPPAGTRAGDWVITLVEHDWHQERGGHSLDFEALPADVVFRPERVHPEPILPNPVTAFVVGPPGEDIHVDELGRVKVQFHWDRLKPRDDTCSHWVPVLQDNTGESIGIPRIGWEVLVHFLEGDPDRPVVLGRVYNAEDTFPYVLPRDKMRTSLKSLSSPTREGSNLIQIDDTAGKETVFVHAEKDQNVVIANNRDEKVLVSEVRHVERHETVEVGANQTETVHEDMKREVQGSHSLSVGANRERNVGSGDGATVQGDRTMTIGGMHNRRIGSDDLVAVQSTLSEQIGAVISELSLDSNYIDARKVLATLVGGALVEVAGEEKSENASKARAEMIGGVVFQKAKGQHQIHAGKTRVSLVGGAVKVKAAKELTLAAVLSMSHKSLMADHEGSTSITLKVGECEVVFKDGVIHMKAPTTIALSMSAKNEQGAKESYQI